MTGLCERCKHEEDDQIIEEMVNSIMLPSIQTPGIREDYEALFFSLVTGFSLAFIISAIVFL